MTPEEFKAKTEEILEKLDNQAEVTAILAELVEHNIDVTKESTEAVEKANKLTTDNETLRQANLNLFLKVGVDKTENKEKDGNTDDEEEKPSFDDLFDENGELK